jgi:8-oxo-dGTP pyrophosphatase MutT (NUDIX family)
MTLRLREAVRGIVVDPDHRVLLVKYVFPSGAERWGTPGGGLDPGETHEDGLRRELYEELGLVDPPIGSHVWNRVHIIPMVSGHDGQRDRFHLVEVPHFDPEPTIGWEQMNAEFVVDIRWWRLDEIEHSDERFVPSELCERLRGLLAEGPPTEPVDVGI